MAALSDESPDVVPALSDGSAALAELGRSNVLPLESAEEVPRAESGPSDAPA